MLPKNKRKIKNFSLTILEIIGTGLLISGVLIAPGLSRLLDPRIYQTKSERNSRIKGAIKKLHQRKLIDIVNQNGEDYIRVTEKGKRRILRYNVDEMKIKKQKRWDGIWRIVIFDIPEKKKIARDVLRNKLKELGFVMLQKSSWIYPYPCKDEIDFISGYFGITPYILYFEAFKIPNITSLKTKFNFAIKK